MKKRTSIVKASINTDLKESVEEILSNLGLLSSDVIRMLYEQIHLHKAIPFELKIPHVPNAETRETIEKALRGEELHKVDSIEQLKCPLKDRNSWDESFKNMHNSDDKLI
jgi:DNA-damage-inducible protein J